MMGKGSVMQLRILTLAAAVALAGCGQVEPVDSLDNLDAANAGAPALNTELADEGLPAPTPSASAGAARIELTTKGLSLVPADGSDARALDFGMDRAAVEQAVAGVLGAGKPGDDCELGPIKTTRYPGIDLSFNDTGFAGWTVDRDNKSGLKTASGIGIGATRKALDAAYKVQVEDSSLGHEFMVDSLDGILSGDAATDTITNLWAGETCVAR